MSIYVILEIFQPYICCLKYLWCEMNRLKTCSGMKYSTISVLFQNISVHVVIVLSIITSYANNRLKRK